MSWVEAHHPEAPQDVIPDNIKVRHYLSKTIMFTTTTMQSLLGEQFQLFYLVYIHECKANKGWQR